MEQCPSIQNLTLSFSFKHNTCLNKKSQYFSFLSKTNHNFTVSDSNMLGFYKSMTYLISSLNSKKLKPTAAGSNIQASPTVKIRRSSCSSEVDVKATKNEKLKLGASILSFVGHCQYLSHFSTNCADFFG